MIKMIPKPIYGKKYLKIFFSRTRRPMMFGLGVWHWGCGAFQVCSNDDPKLTLTYLRSRSNLLPIAFKCEIFWKVDFLNNVEAKVIILTWYVKANETMAINKFQRSRPPHPYILWNKGPMELGLKWYVALGMWSLPAWPTFWQGQIWFLMQLYGKNLEMFIFL